MAEINLETLSRDELTQLHKEVEKALARYEARMRKEALAAAEAKAKEFGFRLSDLAGEMSATSARIPAKYRHPENPELTWSGRGRQPGWVKEHVEAGKPLEELLIA